MYYTRDIWYDIWDTCDTYVLLHYYYVLRDPAVGEIQGSEGAAGRQCPAQHLRPAVPDIVPWQLNTCWVTREQAAHLVRHAWNL